ncbi:hypothetical protein ACHAXS_002921 [Conticribra weissflogii]
MEPEIGFLMANLALAEGRVLDPCCGSGSLLLYAAALGATHLVGVDADASVWSNAAFDRFRFGPPKFYCGDVLDPSSLTEILCAAESFDAIVCDPPYNIGAPIWVNGQDARPVNYHDCRMDGRRQRLDHDDDDDVLYQTKMSDGRRGQRRGGDLTKEILDIARRVLRDGGRIVFFLPVRSNEMSTPLEELLILRGCTPSEVDGSTTFSDSTDTSDGKSERLRLLFGRKQCFTPTFSRWLVCLEKLST